MQRSQNRCDVISPSDTVDNASGRVLCSLESAGQSSSRGDSAQDNVLHINVVFQ